MGTRGTPGLCGLRSPQLLIRYMSSETEMTIDMRVMNGVKKALQRSRRRLAFISASLSSLSSGVIASYANCRLSTLAPSQNITPSRTSSTMTIRTGACASRPKESASASRRSRKKTARTAMIAMKKTDKDAPRP